MMLNKRAQLIPWYFTLPLPLADYQRFQFYLVLLPSFVQIICLEQFLS